MEFQIGDVIYQRNIDITLPFSFYYAAVVTYITPAVFYLDHYEYHSGITSLIRSNNWPTAQVYKQFKLLTSSMRPELPTDGDTE